MLKFDPTNFDDYIEERDGLKLHDYRRSIRVMILDTYFTS